LGGWTFVAWLVGGDIVATMEKVCGEHHLDAWNVWSTGRKRARTGLILMKMLPIDIIVDQIRQQSCIPKSLIVFRSKAVLNP
jgi:hypothetical protein